MEFSFFIYIFVLLIKKNGMNLTKNEVKLYRKLKEDGSVFDSNGDVYIKTYLNIINKLPWEYKKIILFKIKKDIKNLSEASKDIKDLMNLVSQPKLQPHLKVSMSTLQCRLSSIKEELRMLYLEIQTIKFGVVSVPRIKSGKGYKILPQFQLYFGIKVKKQQPIQYRIESMPLHKINTKHHSLNIFLGITNEESNQNASKINVEISKIYGEYYSKDDKYVTIKRELRELNEELNVLVDEAHGEALEYINNKIVNN